MVTPYISVARLRFVVSTVKGKKSAHQLATMNPSLAQQEARNPSIAKSQPKADPPVAEMPSAFEQTSISGAWMER
jgi:hypothetical protein